MFELPGLEVRIVIGRLYSFAIWIYSPFLVVSYFVKVVSAVRKVPQMTYLFNCRTKLAKLECLKCRGNTLLVNSLFCTR